MTQNELDAPAIAAAPRPRTPRTRFELWEVVTADGELVATGTGEQAAWDADDLTAEARADGDAATTYVARPADLTGCERGAAGKLCRASEHAMHGED